MFFKGLLLIHFERVRFTARAEILYLSWVLFILHPIEYDRVYVDETSLDWNSSLLVPVVHADARRAGGVVLDLTETGTDTLGFCDVFDVVALSRWRRQTNAFWGM